MLMRQVVVLTVLAKWTLYSQCAMLLMLHAYLRTTTQNWPLSVLGFWDNNINTGIAGHCQDPVLSILS